MLQAIIFKTCMGWAAILATEAGITRIILPRKRKDDLLSRLPLRAGQRQQAAALRPFFHHNVAPELAPAKKRKDELLAHLPPQGGQVSPPGYGTLKQAVTAIKELLAGHRKKLDLSLDYSLSPPFFKRVYELVQRIPYGQTRTYAWVAKAAGRPGAARAVGNALARNPFPLAVPCHRVIKSNGSLGGFGGGIRLKKELLKLEAEGAWGRK